MEKGYEQAVEYLATNRDSLEREYGNKNLAVLINKDEIRIIDSDISMIKLIKRKNKIFEEHGAIVYISISKATDLRESLGVSE